MESELEINNEVYDRLGHDWWNDNGDGNLVALRFLSNPIKFNYIKSIILKKSQSNFNNASLLDVGCGGGYLAEELSRIGLKVTGIDPSNKSIESAQLHSRQQGLAIDYMVGSGEKLPFESNTFDYICCCDVLEHVKDFKTVITEISRVLKNGGIFFYDTINRTLISKLIMIKIMQEWKHTSFLESNIHIWDMFIKPKELTSVFDECNLENKEFRGLSPGNNFVAHYLNFRKRAKSEITWQELGKRLNLKLTNNLSSHYIGHAEKSKN